MNDDKASDDKHIEVIMIVISGLSARFLRSLNATFNPKATMAINKQMVDTVFKIFSNADG